MVKTNLLEGRRVVARVSSPVNGELEVIKDLAFGTYIHGGGLPQSGGLAEEIWKSTLNRVKDLPAQAGQESRRVKGCLIVGLGGGSIAKLVRKNWKDAKITGVDVDPVIVELGKKYMKLDKQNVNIIIGDAYKLITNYQLLIPSGYDLICFDTYVGADFPKKFESVLFLRQVKKLLSEDGIAIFNRLYGPEDRDDAIKFESNLMEVFPEVTRLYPEANIMFVCSQQDVK